MEGLPLTLSASAVHYVFMRKHEAKSESVLPGDRTLFVSNLPVDCSERQLSQFFKAHGCGTVERVVFAGAISTVIDQWDHEMFAVGDEDAEPNTQPIASTSKITPLPPKPPALRPSGHTAHIVFLDASSIPAVLSLPKSKSAKKLKWPPQSSDNDVLTGLARLTAVFDALHPSLSIARDHADSYMEDYEQRTEAAKLAAAQQSKYKKGEAIVDDDGFTLVTRGGAYGATLGGGAAITSRKFQLDANSGVINEDERRKRKKKEKPDFYTFQIREKKRKGQFVEPVFVVRILMTI